MAVTLQQTGVYDRGPRVRQADGIAEADVLDWLRASYAEFKFDAAGVFRRHGDHDWPFRATDAEDLEAKLLAGWHLLPLSKDPQRWPTSWRWHWRAENAAWDHGVRWDVRCGERSGRAGSRSRGLERAAADR